MEKTEFVNLIDGLGAAATRGKWQPFYDKRLDQFYWHKQPLSEDAVLVKVSRETAVYVSKKGGIEGVMVEYLKSNFVAHNPLFRSLTASFRERVNGSLFTIPQKDRAKAEPRLSALAESLKADIYPAAVEKDHSSDDLAKLVSFATGA